MVGSGSALLIGVSDGLGVGWPLGESSLGGGGSSGIGGGSNSGPSIIKTSSSLTYEISSAPAISCPTSIEAVTKVTERAAPPSR